MAEGSSNVSRGLLFLVARKDCVSGLSSSNARDFLLSAAPRTIPSTVNHEHTKNAKVSLNNVFFVTLVSS
jgi:hypothetical protein